MLFPRVPTTAVFKYVCSVVRRFFFRFDQCSSFLFSREGMLSCLMPVIPGATWIFGFWSVWGGLFGGPCGDGWDLAALRSCCIVYLLI